MINWLLFVALSVVAYTLISWFGTVTGSSDSVPETIKSVFTPLSFALLVAGNVFYGVALFYGFSVSSFALAIALAIGAITAWVYSLVVLGSVFQVSQLLGLGLIIIGIFLLG